MLAGARRRWRRQPAHLPVRRQRRFPRRRRRILFPTGNGPFDVPQGGRDWGDSVIALHPDGTDSGSGLPLDSYTPANFQQLQDSDTDLGSTPPVALPPVPGSRFPHLAVQSGKDGRLRLLNLDNLSGQGQPGKVGGELANDPVPQGSEVLTAPAVWVDPATGTPWLFVANDAGLSALRVVADGSGTPSLAPAWTDPNGGTSPVVANGVVVYVGGAGLRALSAKHGTVLFSDAAPGRAGIHWQSPIVIDGRIYVTDNGGNLWAYAPTAPTTCVPDATTLCLLGGRFQVRAAWQTDVGAKGATGDGQAVKLTADTGYFWFFSASNVEMVTKALDGCALGGRFWLFAGGLTNVHVVLTVVDTANGAVRVYHNPQGTPFVPLEDTSAFFCG